MLSVKMTYPEASNSINRQPTSMFTYAGPLPQLAFTGSTHTSPALPAGR